MITKMLMEIFQAISEDPTVRSILKTFNLEGKKDIDLETLMNNLNLNPAEREKFKKAYKDYYQGKDPLKGSYKYKYEPKSNDPFDKFDSYYQKFEDQFKEGKNDGSHRQYKHYRDQYQQQKERGSSRQNYQKQSNTAYNNLSQEKKYYDTLEVKPGASFEEIKKAYKSAMKKYHPDRFQSDSQKKHAENLSSKINVAFDYFKKKFNQK